MARVAENDATPLLMVFSVVLCLIGLVFELVKFADASRKYTDVSMKFGLANMKLQETKDALIASERNLTVSQDRFNALEGQQMTTAAQLAATQVKLKAVCDLQTSSWLTHTGEFKSIMYAECAKKL